MNQQCVTGNRKAARRIAVASFLLLAICVCVMLWVNGSYLRNSVVQVFCPDTYFSDVVNYSNIAVECYSMTRNPSYYGQLRKGDSRLPAGIADLKPSLVEVCVSSVKWYYDGLFEHFSPMWCSFEEEVTGVWRLVYHYSNNRETEYYRGSFSHAESAHTQAAANSSQWNLSRKEIPIIDYPLVRLPSGIQILKEEGRGSGTVAVTLDYELWMGQYEVSVRQYAKYLMAAGSMTCSNTAARSSVDDDRPAEISWRAANAFCTWLSTNAETAVLLPEGCVYRVPSEAEWEYACRAGSTSIYCSGNTVGDLDHVAWYAGNSMPSPLTAGQKRAPTLQNVGLKSPNSFGLYDMHGNVAEWCFDTWHPTYRGIPTNGIPWIAGGNWDLRVKRGGCVMDRPRSCSSASRGYDSIDASLFIGLRIAIGPK